MKYVLFTVFFIASFILAGCTDNKVMKASGLVEITEYRMGFQEPGYIEKLPIETNQKIKKGDLIAKLDTKEIEAKYDQIEYSLKKAREILKSLQNTPRKEELDEAEALLSIEETQFKNAQREFDRYKKLYLTASVSLEEMEKKELLLNTSKGRLDAARARLSLLKVGTKEELIEAQKMEIGHLKSILGEIEIKRSHMSLYSPIDGVVLTRNFEAGELIHTGNIVATIGDLDECWVKVYIPSTQLADIKINQAVDVHIDSKITPILEGRIKEISKRAAFAPRMNLREDQRDDLYYALKVSITNSNNLIKQGMPADVIFSH